MNSHHYNLIKELAQQAGYEPDMFGVGHWDEPEFRAFTHLLIKECVRRINRVGILEDIELESNMIADAVEEHFGVKL
jgi:hypothetical protein